MKKSKKEQMRFHGEPRIMDLVTKGDKFFNTYIVVGKFQEAEVSKNKGVVIYDIYKLRGIECDGSNISINRNEVKTIKIKNGKSKLNLVCRPVDGGKLGISYYPFGYCGVMPFSLSKDDMKELIKETADKNSCDCGNHIIRDNDVIDSLNNSLKELNRVLDGFTSYMPDMDLEDEDYDDIDDYGDDLDNDDDDYLDDDDDEDLDDEDCEHDEVIKDSIFTLNMKNGRTLSFDKDKANEFLNDFKSLTIKEVHDKYGINKDQRYRIKNELCKALGIDPKTVTKN